MAVRTSQLLLLLLLAGSVPALVAQSEDVPKEEGAKDDPEMEENEDDSDYMRRTISPKAIHALFGAMDKDGDGKLSGEELQAYAKEMRRTETLEFSEELHLEHDTGKDDTISLEEVLINVDGDGDEAALHRHAETQKFKAADKNGDGILSKAESHAFFYPETDSHVELATAKLELERRDLDKDGLLTAQELYESTPEQGHIPLTAEELEDFQVLDQDGDGKLDVHEMKGWESGRWHLEQTMGKVLLHADKDQDGFVTAQELEDGWHTLFDDEARYHLDGWADRIEL